MVRSVGLAYSVVGASGDAEAAGGAVASGDAAAGDAVAAGAGSPTWTRTIVGSLAAHDVEPTIVRVHVAEPAPAATASPAAPRPTTAAGRDSDARGTGNRVGGRTDRTIRPAPGTSSSVTRRPCRHTIDGEMVEANAVTGFLPSVHGLHFQNRYPSGPTVRLGVIDPRLGRRRRRRRGAVRRDELVRP